MSSFGSPDADLPLESAPSDLSEAEMSFPRLLGSIGLGLALVGGFAVIMNVRQDSLRKDDPQVPELLIGKTMAGVAIVFGLIIMLYHAARDGDRLVRRMYIGMGLCGLGAGLALSLMPKPVVGDWLVPWGIVALLSGLFFALAAGRQEDELPWTTLLPGLFAALGIGGTVTGLVGLTLSVDYLPRFVGVALMGYIFWWSAIVRLGTSSQIGYQFGRLLGLVAFAALLTGMVGGFLPGTNRFFVPRGLVLLMLGTVGLLLSIGLVSDRPIVTLARRELAAYFYTPIGYLVLLGVSFIGWLNYLYFVVEALRSLEMRGPQLPEPAIQFFLQGFFTFMVSIAVVPVICMRLVSEEKRSGTVEVLLTAPVGEWQVVLSKFFAALVYFLFLFVPWVLYLIPAYYMGRSGFDYLPLISFILALTCTGAALIASGLFCSTITKNQIIAAVLTFALVLFYFLLPYLQLWIARGHPIGQVLDKLSFTNVWESAVTGRLQWHQLVTYLSVTVMWLYLSVKVLEARKWS